MRFSQAEIDIAQRLKTLGLAWTPQVGNFVYDQSELIEVPSPFQDNVYFILDIKHFLRRSGTVEVLAEKMCWLPTWEDLRGLLTSLDVSSGEITAALTPHVIETGIERLALYQLLESRLGKKS